MLIRQASFDDAEQIIELTSSVADKHGRNRPDVFVEHPYHITKEKLDRIVSSNKHFPFVAEIDGKIVGVMLCTIDYKKNDLKYTDAKILRIEDTCISPDYRREKVGTSLLEAAIEEAKKQNCQRIESNVWAFNTESLHFFESNGFNIQKMTMEWLNNK